MQRINITLIDNNTGQLVDVPQNPRDLTDSGFALAKKSIAEFPEMLSIRTLVVVLHSDRYVVIGGNQRLRALKELGYKEAPCQVVDWNSEQINRFIIADNLEYGKWNYDLLANEWDAEQLVDWGMDLKTDFDDSKYLDKFTQNDDQKGSLMRKFIVPPFSILDTRQGYWRDRYTEWLKITGDLTETKENVLSSAEMMTSISGGSSNFDPVLAEIIMNWFCPVGGKIIDPFGGEQTKGVIAGECGFNYYACEFRQEQVDCNKRHCDKYLNVHYHCGDSEMIDEYISERGFNLCFTSPPYYDLEVYSKDDMSSMGTYEQFMDKYSIIFKKCVEMLADNAFLVIKIGEIRNKKTGIYRNFIGDNIQLFISLGLKYYNEIILLNQTGTAHFRANLLFNNRKVVKLHQNVLVFIKGDIKKAIENCGELNIKYFSDDKDDYTDKI